MSIGNSLALGWAVYLAILLPLTRDVWRREADMEAEERLP
jgi:hypothetical protein